MPEFRKDEYAAGVVDDGLHLMRSEGRYMAAHFMEYHGIPVRVIARVLLPYLNRCRAPSQASALRFDDSRE